jgi:signal transduction histidine kinase
MRSWREVVAKRRQPKPLRKSRGRVLVPIAQRKRVLGVLRVVIDASATDPPDDDLLLAIASACAEVVYKGGLHQELAENERRLAVVAERERIARDLHDSVGQLLTGLGLRLAEYAEDAPDPTWNTRLKELCDQATRGSRNIRDAIQSLLFLQVRNKGLARSLRELTRTFEMTTGIETKLRVSGDVAALATAAEDALFRVAREALMNVERHAQASVVRVALVYGTDGVTVTVTDDGAGMSGDDLPTQPDGHYGLEGLRRLLEDNNGELVLSNLVPKGFRVEGHIPLRGKNR